MRPALRVAASFVLWLATYLLLAGQLSATELAAGAAFAALVAAFGAVQRARADRALRSSRKAASLLLQGVAALPRDTWRVGLALARALVCPVAGSASWQPVHADDPATRAAEVLGASLSPNGIVVGVERRAHAGPPGGPVTPWDWAVAAMLPAFAIPVLGALRGGTADRVAAVQLASSVAMLVLAAMTFAFGQDSFIDLALALPLVSLCGTLAIALFLERWL